MAMAAALAFPGGKDAGRPAPNSIHIYDARSHTLPSGSLLKRAGK